MGAAACDFGFPWYARIQTPGLAVQALQQADPDRQLTSTPGVTLINRLIEVESRLFEKAFHKPGYLHLSLFCNYVLPTSFKPPGADGAAVFSTQYLN